MQGEISLKPLEQALSSLEEGLRDQAQYPQLLTLRDGVIQRFEFTYDLARQTLKRLLKEVFQVNDLDTAKNWIRESARLGLVADAENWMAHLEARNATSHTYNAETAQQVFAHIPGFVADVKDLLKRVRPHVA